MEISQIRYVLSVAKNQSFSRAAEELFISQPALSLQISKLEKELGVLIFSRTSRGVFLTENGRIFCEQGARTVEEWNRLKESMDALRSEPRETLCIGLGPRVFSNHLFEPLMDFLGRNPELKVSFTSTVSRDVDAAFRDEVLDVALDWRPTEDYLSNTSTLAAWELIREKQCIIVAPEDPASRLKECTLQFLQERPVITGFSNSSEDKMLSQNAQELGITINVAYRADNITSVISLVRAGKGIIVGPASVAEYYGLCAVPIVPQCDAALYFICAQKSKNDKQIRKLRNFLLEVCSQKI